MFQSEFQTGFFCRSEKINKECLCLFDLLDNLFYGKGHYKVNSPD